MGPSDHWLLPCFHCVYPHQSKPSTVSRLPNIRKKKFEERSVASLSLNSSSSDTTTMAVKSLATKQGKVQQPVATSSKGESLLTKISHLSSSLPPSAPSSSSLNPLADLVELYSGLKLTLPATATPKDLERNRQEVHTALHTLKAVFESLINAGRLHGVLKGSKRSKIGGEVNSKAQSKEEAIVEKVKAWLKERWEEYLAQTAKVAGTHWDHTVRVSDEFLNSFRRRDRRRKVQQELNLFIFSVFQF